MKAEITGYIQKTALELGFYKCGIARAEELHEERVRLKKWLEEGRHGTMNWMENHLEKEPTRPNSWKGPNRLSFYFITISRERK